LATKRQTTATGLLLLSAKKSAEKKKSWRKKSMGWLQRNRWL